MNEQDLMNMSMEDLKKIQEVMKIQEAQGQQQSGGGMQQDPYMQLDEIMASDMSPEEKREILQQAASAGLDVSKYEAGFLTGIGHGALQAVDSALFGLIPDSVSGMLDKGQPNLNKYSAGGNMLGMLAGIVLTRGLYRGFKAAGGKAAFSKAGGLKGLGKRDALSIEHAKKIYTEGKGVIKNDYDNTLTFIKGLFGKKMAKKDPVIAGLLPEKTFTSSAEEIIQESQKRVAELTKRREVMESSLNNVDDLGGFNI